MMISATYKIRRITKHNLAVTKVQFVADIFATNFTNQQQFNNTTMVRITNGYEFANKNHL